MGTLSVLLALCTLAMNGSLSQITSDEDPRYEGLDMVDKAGIGGKMNKSEMT